MFGIVRRVARRVEDAAVHVRCTEEPAIATLTIIESRVVLALLLLSGGVVLLLAALVDQPAESHGHAEAAASSSEHVPGEPATAEAMTDPDENIEHSTETEATPEVTGSTKTDHGASGGEEPEPDHEERRPDSLFGFDLGSLNLATPRLTAVVIGLTFLLAVALATWRSPRLLLATVGLGLAGVAVGVHEGIHASEELGIFVPLPILASVLSGGASALAGLAVITSRAQSVAAKHE
jgi:hypothetical protein